MWWNRNHRSGLIAPIVVATALTTAATAYAAKSVPIPWVKDLAAAMELAKKTGRPIIVFWKGAKPHEWRRGHEDKRKKSPESYLQKMKTGLFPKLEANPRTQKFVWLQINFEEDKDTVKAFRINEHWMHFVNTDTWPAPNGFVFANAEGKIYGRIHGRPLATAFDDMMVGVLKAHSPPGSRIRAVPYDTRIKYRPYISSRRKPPSTFTPHPETWRECSKCGEALKKAMGFIKKYPKLGWMSGFFAGFAYMMADGCEENLKRCVEKARHAARPHWGGYSNWEISGSMLLITEYSLRYGLTPENREVLIKAQQYASENVENGGGWFHHAKHGGANYAWDIGLIGAIYFAAFLEMEALGLEAQPALSMGRGYLERLSGFAGYNFGYGTPHMGAGPSSVGKNGFVMMGFHASGQPDEPFARLLGDFLNDYPDGPQVGHATSWHHFFGAGVGAHRRGPETYAKYAGVWLHAIIDCQKEDGSIGPFPHDMNTPGLPVEIVLGGVKKGGNVAATAILASLILMTEPGTFSGLARKKPRSPPNKRAFEIATKAFEKGAYGEAYKFFGLVLPPGKDLDLLPVARKQKAEIRKISNTKLAALTEKEAALRKRVEDEGSSVDIVIAWQEVTEEYKQYAKDFEGLHPVRIVLKRRSEMRKRLLGLRLKANASAKGRRRPSTSSRTRPATSGTKATGSAPVPVAAGMPDAAVQATWEKKLHDRVGTRLKTGARIRFELKSMRTRVTIAKMIEKGITVRMSNGGQIDMKWSQFKAADKRSLAAGLAATSPTSEDHALAAFYYLLDGNKDKARGHLSRAGKQAANARPAPEQWRPPRPPVANPWPSDCGLPGSTPTRIAGTALRPGPCR